MLKVKLKHGRSDLDKVYITLADNDISIVCSNGFGDVTTCLVEDDVALRSILKLLNQRTYGVQLLSARPTLSTLLRSLTK